MAALSIEITAPELVSALNHLAGALVNATNSALKVTNPAPLPEAPAEQAIQQQVNPAPAPVPTYASPAVPLNQPQNQPAPVNLTPAPRPAAPGAPVATTPTTPQAVVPTAPVPVQPAIPAEPPGPVNHAPVSAAPTYQIDDLARAAAQLMDAGKQQELLGLLAKFNVQALTQLPQEQYGTFATELRQMGAKL